MVLMLDGDYDSSSDIELDYNVILIPIINNISDFNNEIDVIPFYSAIQKEGVVLSE